MTSPAPSFARKTMDDLPSDRPMDRLREMWLSIAGRYGWEYMVLRSAAVCTAVTGFAAGYFISGKKNEERLIQELKARNVQEPAFSSMLQKRLFAANVLSGLKIGLRLAVVPVTLSAITLSSIAYRNDVLPLDIGVLYGMAGGTYGLRGGVKQAALVSGVTAAFGMCTGFVIILFLRRNEMTISDMRTQLTLQHRSQMEYENLMNEMRKRDAEYRRSLVQRELQQMEDKKRRND